MEKDSLCPLKAKENHCAYINISGVDLKTRVIVKVKEHQGTFCVGRNVYYLGGMFTWVHPHMSFYQNLRSFIKPKIFVLFFMNFTFQI